MIRRDEGFWRPVIEHPEVAPHVSLGSDLDWLPVLLGSPDCLPFACEHGGYFFVQTAPLARLWDLHAAFLPSGWGRAAHDLLRTSLRRLRGWDLITVSEVSGNWRSRPPRSFGFRPAAPEQDGFRTWVLTRTAWEQSPAFRRMETQCLPC